ncbi:MULTISPECIES: hypothetical protein [Rhizobium]|uniref:hypothetical protein n=1 Tax=Rhizobium TaxID=379 RepID=UPI00041FCE9C|nr:MULTISPECIES: hypothetical protein [Rhizobium]MBB3520986.1 hypothetical protein [Rhizobium sp. BK456]UFS81548.1 hypothetical protein LPB79_25080 [Rhizobium sp. T136]
MNPTPYTADFLLDIAKSTPFPLAVPYEDWHSTLTFDARNGWQIAVFYDGEEFDYIEHFVAPDGSLVNAWDWPDTEQDENAPFVCGDKERIIFWRP